MYKFFFDFFIFFRGSCFYIEFGWKAGLERICIVRYRRWRKYILFILKRWEDVERK